jgi:NitT/TauT family transport system substrate-binding protein
MNCHNFKCVLDKLLFLGLLVGATMLAEPNQAIAQEKLRIGYSALRISLPVFVALEKGFFSDAGLSVELQRFETAQPLMQALAAGTIQVGGYTALPITFSAMQRSNRPLYFVTAMIEDDLHPVSYLLVPKDSPPAMKIGDLRGKKIGILPTVAYRKWLEVIMKENGVAAADISIVPIDPLMQPIAFRSGQVQALFTNDPAAAAMMQNGIARKINDDAIVPKYFGSPFLFGSFNIDKEYADKNPETAAKIVRAISQAARYVNEFPAEAKQMMAKYVHESQRSFVSAYPDALYRSGAEMDPSLFQQTADRFVELGILEKRIDLSGLIK